MKRRIRLTESDLRNIVKESVKIILEGASKKLYHYCGINQLKKMIKTDNFFFSNERYNGIKDYVFSTTRMRNSKQGYAPSVQMYGGAPNNDISPLYFIRLELDGEMVQNLQYDYRNKHYGVKVEPFDYFWHENREEEPRLNGKQMEFIDTAKKPEDEEALMQTASQAEDRIFSKKKSVGGFKKCLTRIDVWFDIENIYDYEEEVDDALEACYYLLNLMYELDIDIYFYTNQDAFNIQANKTVSVEEIIDVLKDIQYSML